MDRECTTDLHFGYMQIMAFHLQFYELLYIFSCTRAFSSAAKSAAIDTTELKVTGSSLLELLSFAISLPDFYFPFSAIFTFSLSNSIFSPSLVIFMSLNLAKH